MLLCKQFFGLNGCRLRIIELKLPRFFLSFEHFSLRILIKETSSILCKMRVCEESLVASVPLIHLDIIVAVMTGLKLQLWA